MKPTKSIIFFLSCFMLFGLYSCAQSKNILVFSKTAGYRHESIEDGIKALKKLGKENDFTIVATEDSSLFNNDTLEKFVAVLFLSTTGDILNRKQEISFEKFVQSGGGFIGIHAASDTEYEWEWYAKMVGANFLSHPEQQNADILVIDHNHKATDKLPKVWNHFDEWYNFKNINPVIKVLARVDESSYKGGANGENHPVIWYHEYDGGKVFYTALGHTKEAFTDKKFLMHLLGGIQYVIED